MTYVQISQRKEYFPCESLGGSLTVQRLIPVCHIKLCNLGTSRGIFFPFLLLNVLQLLSTVYNSAGRKIEKQQLVVFAFE